MSKGRICFGWEGNMQVGDIIAFGNYEWRVLEVQNDRVLIITECIIEQRPYHDTYKEITWADCSLRKYLNTELYNTFNVKDQTRIMPVINKNFDNHCFGRLDASMLKRSISMEMGI
jgi:hypothetical protein